MSIDHSKLDLAFVLDTTGSMGDYIEHAKQNINKISDQIRMSEKVDLRVGIVNYRDHPPQDRTYITMVHHITGNMTTTKKFIDKTRARGGGDCPEAVCCGLSDCLDILMWRDDAVKVAILIADAPPHGLGVGGDGFKNGCPKKKDPVEIVHKMAQKGITLYTAGVEPLLIPYRQFFIALSLITGGQYVPLDNADRLTEVIVGGAREDISMEKLMARVHNEYMKEVAENGERVNEDELTKRIHQVLNSTSDSKINSVKNFEAVKISDDIKELAKEETLKKLVDHAKNKNIDLLTFATPAPVAHTAALTGKVAKRVAASDSEEEYVPEKKRGTSKRTVYAKRGRKTLAASTTTDEPATKTDVATDDKKEDESVDVDQARRLAKKVIARNK